MNQARRKNLRTALEYLEYASRIVERTCDEETDVMENCPENLQTSLRYESMETAVDALEDAQTSLDEAIEKINEAIGV